MSDVHESGTTESRIWPRMLRNTGWLLGARGINMPLALLESVFLARVLGVAGYGTLGLVIATVTAVQRLFSFRMNEFTIRYLSEALEKEDRDQAGATLKMALTLETVTAAIACGIAYLAAPRLAAGFVPGPESARLIRLFAVIALGSAGFETATGALQVFDRFRFLAGINVLRKTVLITGLGASFIAEGSLVGILVAYIAASTFANAAVVTTLIRGANTRLGKRWWAIPTARVRSKWREMGHFAVTTNLGATLSLIIKDSDLLWIGFFRSPEEAGYYKLATTFLKVPFAAGSPMSKAFYPEIARLVHSASVQKLRRFLKHSTLVAAAWVGPLAVLAAVLAPLIVQKLYGPSFLPAVHAIWILLVGTALAHVFFWTRPTLLALGRPHVPLRISVLNAILKIGLGFALVPAWGYLGLSAILSGLNLNGLTLASFAIKHELKHKETAREAE